MRQPPELRLRGDRKRTEVPDLKNGATERTKETEKIRF
jgi:hypothetical protein